MSASRIIAVANGDGIGPEIMTATLNVFKAAKVPLEYEFVEMGKYLFDKGISRGMTDAAVASVEATGILFKGPMETPKGGGGMSINVTARKMWGAFANQRHFRSLPGVETVFSRAGKKIDLLIVRENIEDCYGGIEHRLSPDVTLSRRLITAPGSHQVHENAFEVARKMGFKDIACGHKANIMKFTDGLFLNLFRETAQRYPDLNSRDIIVDDLCMKLVMAPEKFQVLVLPNLQGDIVSDLCAGLVGGLGFAPSSNIGERISIFEAVHGTAPDIAGQNKANPTALLMAGIMMLRHLGLVRQAALIENALMVTLESGVHTGDFGDSKIPTSGTLEFGTAIIKNLGKKPTTVPARDENEATETKTQAPLPVPSNRVLVYQQATAEIVGADFFIESHDNPEDIAQVAQPLGGDLFNLSVMANRGTQVWPKGSKFTELVDVYCLRFEKKAAIKRPLDQKDIMALTQRTSETFMLQSLEVLRNFDGQRGYTLVQGQ
jgi:isocitrate dehydrogenase